MEIQTIQSLPLERRAAAVAAVAQAVAPGGELFVRAAGRGDDEPTPHRPWPVSRAELAPLGGHGLSEESFVEHHDADGDLWFHASYRRTDRGRHTVETLRGRGDRSHTTDEIMDATLGG